MPVIKIYISRKLPEKVTRGVNKKFQIYQRDSTKPMSQSEATESLENFDAIIPTLADDFGKQTFERAKSIKCNILANFGAGYNHIDIEAAKNAGIVVTNTPGAVTEATADIAMTLILTTARRTSEGERLVRSNQWTGWQPTQMLGTKVSGGTLGIIGMGNIGKAIAKRCHAGFGMRVVFYNRSLVNNPGVPATQLGSAKAVVKQADFVVIAVRGGVDSHHLVSEQLLKEMNPNGILINISRGDVVDESALIHALETKQIAGAGLDVYEFEPKVPEELQKMENVVLLPHLGTAILKVREDMGLMAVKNLVDFFRTGNPPNRVI